MTREQQLQAIQELCRSLGADVRYDPEYRHLIVLAWEDKGEPYAQFVQQQIRRQVMQFPGLVCYCFDTFSTLVYAT